MKRTKLFIFCFFFIFSLNLPVFSAEVSDLNLPNINPISSADSLKRPVASMDFTLETAINPSDYILGPGDILDIHLIVGDADVTIDHALLVGADGKIFFPKVGAILLSGLNINQAKNKIDQKIKSIYHSRYKIYVLLSQPKQIKIYLTGMIKNPGPITVYDHARISEVIASAGGVVSGGSNRFVYVKRKGSYKKFDLYKAFRNEDLSQDFPVKTGDIISIPSVDGTLINDLKDDNEHSDTQLLMGKETFVYVYGDVKNSGRFEFVPGKKVSDYISYAGGPVPSANLSATTVARSENGKNSKIRINLSDIIYNGSQKGDFEVIGGDVINVPRNFFYFSDFSSFASMLLTGVGLYNTFVK